MSVQSPADRRRAGADAALKARPMAGGWRLWLAACLAACALSMPAAAAAGAAEAGPKRVLIVHSFGRDVAPYDAAIATFRRELASRADGPVVFYEATLDAGRRIGPGEEAAFVAYLAQRFSQPAPDLIVSSAVPAAAFLLRHREALFPQVPVLLTALDARRIPTGQLRPGDAAVATHIDIPRAFESLLHLLPQTRTIAVVMGQTPLERFWRQEFERDTAYLAGRVRIDWLDELSLPQMQQRVAALPPDAAVFYALLVVDGAGVPHERLEALADLRKAARVPIFSVFENELGHGVVGGPGISQTRVGRETAHLALRRLRPPLPSEPELVRVDMDHGAFDARELARWQIDPTLLPAGSVLRFAEAPLWLRYRAEILVIAAVIAAQAALIAALLLQRARRQRAEQEARALGGRLITAYEDEARRLGRELHDDITQRLAGVAIEAAALDRHADPAERRATAQSISGELAALSRDVHALSYRLHPSVVDDLGLGEALRMDCERAARRGAAQVSFDGDAGGSAVRGERALCLFRVAQEALRNALRHAQPRQVQVELRDEGGGIRVRVTDDGSGFDTTAPSDHASLGLASMRERVALLGGRLEIHSRRGQGTQVTAWVPAETAA